VGAPNWPGSLGAHSNFWARFAPLRSSLFCNSSPAKLAKRRAAAQLEPGGLMMMMMMIPARLMAGRAWRRVGALGKE